MGGTIQEIADKAGVSRGTVDRALNNRGRINQEVAENIKRIAKEIGYTPKPRAKKIEKIKIGVVTQLSASSFMIPIRRGLKDAERELENRNIECIIKEVQGVNEEEQVKALEELSEEKVNGIAIMPVESPRVLAKINDLAERGIEVATFNSDIIGSKRSFFVGLDNKKSGSTAAGLMGMLSKKSGKVLAITGYFGNSVSSSRVDGFVEEIKKSFPEIELVGVQSSFDDSEEVEKIILNTIASFPDLSGIVVFSGGQAGIKRAFEKLELEPQQRPYTIIYDITEKNKQALDADIVDFLIDQDGYRQGYRSLTLLADQLQDADTPNNEFVYTDIIIKTKYNL